MQTETSIQTERKPHNHGAVIPPAAVELMLASGKTVTEVAAHFNVDKKTLYYRRGKDADLDAAFENGLARWNRKPQAIPSATNTGAQLEHLLTEIYCDLKEIRAGLIQ